MERRGKEGGGIGAGAKVKTWKVSLLLFSVLFLWTCGPHEDGKKGDVLARVGEEIVTLEEFEKDFRGVILESGKEVNGRDLKELRTVCLDQIIERKILIQEARKNGIEVSDDELNPVISELKRDYSDREFRERLSILGMTADEWKSYLREKLIAEKMMRKLSSYQGKVSDAEALKYYEENRSLFQLPERVRVRQIVVLDGEEALQILRRLRRGENFEKLALEKSVAPEKVRGGDLGYFSRGEKPPEFDLVFNMRVGAISEVVKSSYGYHIFKLEDKIPPRQVSFEEAKSGIVEELARKKGEEEYRKWLSRTKERIKIKINKKLIRS